MRTWRVKVQQWVKAHGFEKYINPCQLCGEEVDDKGVGERKDER